MKARSDHATPDLFAEAYGNQAARERLAMELRSKPALQAAATRRRIAATSREAHEHVKPRTGDLHARCLAAMPYGPPGMTADECAASIHEEVLTVRPRFTEMFDAGLIAKLASNGVPMRRKNKSGRNAYVFARVKQ